MLFARLFLRTPKKLLMLRLAHRIGLTRVVPPLAKAYARETAPRTARRAAVVALPVVAAGVVAGMAMRRRSVPPAA